MFDVNMTHPVLALARVQVHCNDLLEEAEFHRLLKKAKAGRPRLQDHLLLSLGDLLISFGLRLKARYQPDSAAPIFRVG